MVQRKKALDLDGIKPATLIQESSKQAADIPLDSVGLRTMESQRTNQEV